MAQELVSICIPAYRDAEGLERLLTSIAGQTYTQYEVIVSDDSPDDACENVAAKFMDTASGTPQERKMQISYERHAATGRPADNWNAALSKAKGTYIKMMLHDDWFTAADSLERFVQLLDTHREVPFAFSGTEQVSEDCRFARHILDRDAALLEENIRNLFLGNTIGAPSAVIFRRDGNTFDPGLKWLVDMDFYLRVMKGEGKRFVYTNEPLVSIGISEKQMTSYCRQHPNLVRKEYLKVYRKHHFSDQAVYRSYLLGELKKPH